jgi:WD40 repeat protein
MAHQVFICYSSKDTAVADAARAALEAQHIRCWIAPRDILAGDEYGNSIIEALSTCQIVVLIFSSNANASPQVRREIERAVSKKKTIVPFRIEDALPTGAMEYALSNTHWLDALTSPLDGPLASLCETVSQLMRKQMPLGGPLKEAPDPILGDRFTPPVPVEHTTIPPPAAVTHVPAPAATAGVSRRTFLWTAGAGAGVVAAGGIWLVQSFRRRPLPPAVHVMVQLLAGASAADAAQRLGSPAIAPDGSAFVVSLSTPDGTYLFHRLLNSEKMTRMEGTLNAAAPFWSPDSQNIGFFVAAQLKRMPAAGGSPIVLCNAPEQRGATWGSHGVILFGINGQPLFKVAETGGTPVAVTSLDLAAGENSHRFPVFLPDGNSFLYFARTDNLDKRGIYVESLDRKRLRRRVLVADGQFVLGRVPDLEEYFLLTQQTDKVVAQSFDIDRGEVSGAPHTLLDHAGQISVSDTGVLVVRTDEVAQCRIQWLDRAGHLVATLDKPDDWWQLTLSPDGRLAAIVRHDSLSGQQKIWLASVPDGTLEPFSDSTHAGSLAWSHDGSTLFYTDYREKKILRRAVQPRGPEEIVLETTTPTFVRAVSLDGRRLVAEITSDDLHADLVWTQIDQKQWHTLASGLHGLMPSFSPDGKWLAFSSNRTGREEIYLMDFPGNTVLLRISTNGGVCPRWRRDGKELFYTEGNQMMAVDMTVGDKPHAGTPKLLFQVNLRGNTKNPIYDVAADGQHFLVIAAPDKSVESSIEMILNWPSLLPQ